MSVAKTISMTSFLRTSRNYGFMDGRENKVNPPVVV